MRNRNQNITLNAIDSDKGRQLELFSLSGSSFDGRYVLTSSYNQFTASFTSSVQTIGDVRYILTSSTNVQNISSSFNITGSIQLSGNLGISGSVFFNSGSGIQGTTTGNDSQSGLVGECLESYTTSIGSWTTNTFKNVGSLTLTAGDWDVYGTVRFRQQVGANASDFLVQVNSSSAAYDNTEYGLCQFSMVVTGSGGSVSCVCPVRRFNLSASATVFAVGRILFSAGPFTGSCIIHARRDR